MKCSRCGMKLDPVSTSDHSTNECINHLNILVGLEKLRADMYETRLAFDYSPTMRNVSRLFYKWLRNRFTDGQYEDQFK